ncbi:hypothetical protein GJAV_G00268420 [Gymnothorax javanicus]|nr:hypothetical protein GJAV_G00268420 [Gymnothorax javanicus]
MAALVKAVKEAIMEDVTQQVYESLHLDMEQLEKEIQYLSTQVKNLQRWLHEVDEEIDDQEQYSRRNCLIIHGSPEYPNEDTDATVSQFTKKELSIEIHSRDIDLSHRLAQPPRPNSDDSRKSGPPISRVAIVWFATYNMRQLVIILLFQFTSSCR